MAGRPLEWLHQKRAIALPLILAVACLGPARAQQDETQQGDRVSALVDRCIEAYGGADRLRGIESWRQVGTVISPTRGEGVMARVFAPPERLRVEIRFSGEGGETRILNGERGWRSGQAVQGPPYVAMVLQAARLALPLILLEGKDRVRDLGEAEGSGRVVRRLDLELRDQMRLEVDIDPKTARIVRSRSIAGPLVFETAYEDFREVDGVLFPFVETTWAMGHETGRFEIDQVALGGELDDRAFLP